MALLFVLAVSSSGIPGGYTEKDANDPECQRAAWAAMTLQNAADGENRELKDVESCAIQIVAGRNTRLVLEVCHKQGKKYTNCVLCSILIFEGLKRDQFELKSFDCNKRSPSKCASSVREVQELAEEP